MPGAIAFTRILFGAKSFAVDLVKPKIAAFVVAYKFINLLTYWNF